MNFGKAIPYDVKIDATANNGFIVYVGCAIFVFKDASDLSMALDAYLKHPKDCENQYSKAFSTGEPTPGPGPAQRPILEPDRNVRESGSAERERR